MAVDFQPVGEPSIDLWLKFRDYIDHSGDELSLVANAPADAREAFGLYEGMIAGSI
jgi:hypothetical protein